MFIGKTAVLEVTYNLRKAYLGNKRRYFGEAVNIMERVVSGWGLGRLFILV